MSGDSAMRIDPEEHIHAECIRCGYDLYGLTINRCPECGLGFDPRQLRQSLTVNPISELPRVVRRVTIMLILCVIFSMIPRLSFSLSPLALVVCIFYSYFPAMDATKAVVWSMRKRWRRHGNWGLAIEFSIFLTTYLLLVSLCFVAVLPGWSKEVRSWGF